ncbi:hypothetical protein HNY73_018628 [Argiope bruennichi]|uniref:BTB domain-containing protein n=1 Tax=Argiope bruennichi TaxID=94029 RepID=A0A8T0EIG9_ARGBR|nr:hypothetical protein HNY73_018628 [Argiope bruennichi]
MFSTDMREKGRNCVNIEDMSNDAISQMLAYIYTARMEYLTWERAFHLNACQVLLMPGLDADEDFKSAVQGYIIKHAKDIMTSGEWKLLIETNGNLLLRLCVSSRNKI